MSAACQACISICYGLSACHAAILLCCLLCRSPWQNPLPLGTRLCCVVLTLLILKRHSALIYQHTYWDIMRVGHLP